MFPTPLAFSRWAYALSRATAGRMGATTYLVPLLAVLMGWTILGEVPRRSPWSAAVVVPDEKKRQHWRRIEGRYGDWEKNEAPVSSGFEGRV